MSSAPDFISTLNKKTKDLVYWGFTEHARLIILFVFILVCRGSVNPLYYPHQCTIHFLHNSWNMFLMLKEIHVFIIALKERFWCFDKGGLMQDEFCCEVHHPVSLLRHRRLRRCCSCWCFCRRSFFGGWEYFPTGINDVCFHSVSTFLDQLKVRIRIPLRSMLFIIVWLWLWR